MMDPRPLGIVLVLIGGVGTAIAALADPLGLSINADNHFGWLQLVGVIVGAVVVLLGLVTAAEWVPWASRGDAGAAGTTAAPETALEELSLRVRVHERESAGVGVTCLVVAAESSHQLGADRVQVVVVLEL